MSRTLLIVTLLATVACALVFAVWPGLDLAAARLFYQGDGRFVGRGPLGDILRAVGYLLPFIILALFVAAWALRRLGWSIPHAPHDRSVVMLVVTMALAPGIMANLVLKDHSHRPRPVHVREFGGSMEFRPWYRFDGACAKNCSFVSGESSEAFWTLAPAILAPPSVRPYAMAAALIFGVTISLLRMAFGGHFLSDVVFAALFTIVIVAGASRLLLRRAR